MKIAISSLSLMALFSCYSDAISLREEHPLAVKEKVEIIVPKEGQIISRFNPPEGYNRTVVAEQSFGNYLRTLPLKPHNTLVKYYNGKPKTAKGVYAAVIDLPIGRKNLHQCADAIMRLKADYHFGRGEYDKIHFNLTNGFKMDYTSWKNGNRLKVAGNKTWWVKQAEPTVSGESYWQYLEMIFSYAGTLSLSKELRSVDVKNIEIGDVFIQGGSPGHAVIVVDLVQNKKEEKLMLLAQSYMPAQETQLLVNPLDEELVVWFPVDFGEQLITPEWTFYKSDLKRFE